MQSSFWLTCLLGFALLNQGWCRPQEDGADYPNDGETDIDYDDEEDNENSGPPPTITTKPLTVNLNMGGVAVFPCVVEGADEDSFSRVWRKNTEEGLYVGSVKSHKKPNITLLPDGALQVHVINPEYAGVYTCMVARNTERQEVKHTLNINGPAKITKVTPHEDTVTVKKHSTLTLECYAQGFPAPSTKWYKDGSLLNLDEDPSDEGARLIIYEVKPENAGEYQCRSYNEGQAIPDERTVTVQVNSPPEIEIEKAVVSTGEGEEAELTCVLIAQKKSELKWYKVGTPKQLLTHNDRVSFKEKGDEHTLIIKKIKKSDFGDYTCEAKNSEGQDSATITLTGNPTTPLLELSESVEGNPSLVYKIESFAPIEEYELLYKNTNVDKWLSHKPAVTPATEGNVFRMKHVFSELEPGNYEAKIRARNSDGWSSFSSVYQFPKEHQPDQTQTGPLEAVSSNKTSVGSELRISLSLIVSLLIARFYC